MKFSSLLPSLCIQTTWLAFFAHANEEGLGQRLRSSRSLRETIKKNLRDFGQEDNEATVQGVVDLVSLAGDEWIRDFDDLPCTDTPPPLDCSNVPGSVFRLFKHEICNTPPTPFPFVGLAEATLKSNTASIVSEVVDSCDTINRKKRELQDVSQCVRRFDDATYDGQVPVPPDLPGGVDGTVSKYGWATDFNEQCGVGIAIHSGGGLVVIEGDYSLPTFTLRDAFGSIVYQGVYGVKATPQSGLRSALVVACDEPNIITVVATSVGNRLAGTNGEFLEFRFDLNEYSGKPIFGVNPFKRTSVPAPSVRKQLLITEDVILYAPLFDNGLPGLSEPTLRLFNWRTTTELGVEITFTPDTSGFIPNAFVWDIECEDQGLCWLTTIALLDDDPTVLELEEETISRLFSFPLSVFDPVPTQNINIPVREAPLDISIPFTTLSLEPLTPTDNLACTLSGFLFALANANIDGISTDVLRIDPVTGERRGSFGILNLFELGFVQECNICSGNGGCRRGSFRDLKNTNVYIWALQECGNKVFAGTNDQSLFFGNILLEAFKISLAEVSCVSTVPRLFACVGSSECRGIGNRRDGCEIEIETTFQNVIDNNGRDIRLTAQLVSGLFEELILPSDLGFDLYAIDKDRLLSDENPVFEPITFNGFAALSPPDNIDEGVRNLACHTSPFGGDPKLVITSAVFRDEGQTSSTFVLDVNDRCTNRFFA